MPSEQDINMYDLNFDKKLDQKDIDIADQIGMPSIASAIKNVMEGEAANLNMSQAIQNYDQSVQGEGLKEVITESLKPEGIDDGTKLQIKDIDASLLTANPMPSMPSISNVGSVPFSGSVSHNAIPGGFQPLPQIAGQKKKLYQLSKFHGGLNLKSSPRDISDTECQQATNVTFSNIGRITLLGDIKSTSSGLSTGTVATSATHIPVAGYGLFVFKSGYSLGDNSGSYSETHTPIQGNFTMVASTDGQHVSINDQTRATGDYLNISGGTDTQVAPVFYAAGNGLYACNANFLHTSSERQCAILVHRKDFLSSGETDMTTNLWIKGDPLIDSPSFSDAADTVKKVNLEWIDGMGSSFTATTTNDTQTVHIGSSGSGNWNGTYHFYISYLFDGQVETGLTSLIETGGTIPPFVNESLQFNFSTCLDDNSGTRVYMGGNARVNGARIYFREVGTSERYLLAEVNIVDGIKGALDSNFTPWDNNSDTFDLATNITFESPPEIYTYASLNGYYANEVYDNSPEPLADGTTGPSAHDVRYRTAAVGANGAVFIGCYIFKGKVFADGMMYSMPNKPAVFPEYNVFDSPSSDGTPITALVAFRDKILQFKEDALYVINISNPSQFYTEASFRNCGIMNPCQAFQTPFGVIFANKHGCYIYYGAKVVSLTSGKFNQSDWGLEEDSIVDTIDTGKDAKKTPCVGYDPRTQSIIVLKDIGDNGTSSTTPNATSAWVYSMNTQSWTEGTDMITNTNADRHTNFVISPSGYLSIQQDAVTALKTYDVGEASSNTQTITYIAKDIDFGLSSQTKKIFKVYVTYTSGSSNVPTATHGSDGAAPTTGFSSGNFATGQTNAVATFVANVSNIKSFAIKITGTVDKEFEINDISILYRSRPIK